MPGTSRKMKLDAAFGVESTSFLTFVTTVLEGRPVLLYPDNRQRMEDWKE